jgi:hypothetical protein
MNKIFALLSLAVLMLNCTGVTHAGGCPDGSEPAKSVSADGTYFVYNCGGQSSSSSVASSNTGTVEIAMKPDTGDWLNESIYPLTVKKKMLEKYKNIGAFAIGDFDNDGIDELFILGASKVTGKVMGTNSPACDVNQQSCFSPGPFPLEIYSIEGNQAIVVSDSVSGLLVTNNPIEMSIQAINFVRLADFNSDGILDIFLSDAGMEIVDGKKSSMPGKNDHYYLSQSDGTWLESTLTHVTGTSVKKNRGLINFSHGSTVGDIDGDGDMDIIVSSINWRGNNGEILCYVNQGKGHMIVRKCGDQWGFEVELGDIDNDGDLDILFGGELHEGIKDFGIYNRTPSCSASRCLGAYSGILLNDGKGNFFKRGFEFSEHKNSNGFWYGSVPNISVADLDGDGDLDVVRMLVGNLYAGVAMTIEENIGNGQFKTILVDEWCKGPESKAVWPTWEGGEHNCFATDFKFGDFNKDGLVDIVVAGSHVLKDMFNFNIVDGTVYLSTGKFKYDVISPDDENYPLGDVEINYFGSLSNSSQREVEDELAAFEAELAAELGQ